MRQLITMIMWLFGIFLIGMGIADSIDTVGVGLLLSGVVSMFFAACILSNVK